MKFKHRFLKKLYKGNVKKQKNQYLFVHCIFYLNERVLPFNETVYKRKNM